MGASYLAETDSGLTARAQGHRVALKLFGGEDHEMLVKYGGSGRR